MTDGRRSWAKKGRPVRSRKSDPVYPGFVNFIDVVRSRKREDQLAEVEEGAISTMLIHLANISYRTGRTLYFDPVTYTCKGDAEATAMFTRASIDPRSPFRTLEVRKRRRLAKTQHRQGAKYPGTLAPS